VKGETMGAACSSLLAVEYINNKTPLIIANADQLFDTDLNDIINFFSNFDGGVITFDSIHPRWSYVCVDERNFITEASEKRPLSRNAVAGFYYFKEGKDFVNSAMAMIKKNANINGIFYIAPSLNEMILNNKKITIYKVENDNYHSFYTIQNIKNYERLSKS